DGLALLRGELLLVGVQDDGAKAPRGLGHLVPQAVQHLLEVTARDADLVAERLPQRRGTRSHTDEDDEPERQHAPGVRGAPASETVEERGHGWVPSGVAAGETEMFYFSRTVTKIRSLGTSVNRGGG